MTAAVAAKGGSRRAVVMNGVGDLPVPAVSDSECVVPGQQTQLGTIATMRLRTGLPPLSSDESSVLPVRLAVRRRVRRTCIESSDDGAAAVPVDGGESDVAHGSDKDPPPRDLSDGDGGGDHLQNEDGDGEGAAPGGAVVQTGGSDAAPATRSSRSRPRKRSRPSAVRSLRGTDAGVPLSQRKALATSERRDSMLCVLNACLLSASGAMTAVEDFDQDGVSARVVSALACPSRVVFCRFGPALVDLAGLWISPFEKVLCSCYHDSHNVALASVTRRESTCWHADVFRAAMDQQRSRREKILRALQLQPTTQPHAFSFELLGTRCALSFDGDIFSPVVASEKRLIRCISAACRSMERSCAHAKLTRALPVFNASRRVQTSDGQDEQATESSCTDGTAEERPTASTDYGKYAGSERDDHRAILACALSRKKRNLLPCAEEQRQSDVWQRTADVISAGLTPASVVTPQPRGADTTEPSAMASNISASDRPFESMLRCGLVVDPNRVLYEKQCTQCLKQKPDSAVMNVEPAVIYTQHATASALQVSGVMMLVCA